jgi:predicted MFS family arabinose efflux permease
LWALSKNFALFVLARIVGGISKGNVSLSMAVITDVSSLATRGRAMVSYCLFCFLCPLRTDLRSHKNKVIYE